MIDQELTKDILNDILEVAGEQNQCGPEFTHELTKALVNRIDMKYIVEELEKHNFKLEFLTEYKFKIYKNI